MGDSVITVNVFPTPEDLSRVPISDLRECGLGYRDDMYMMQRNGSVKNILKLIQKGLKQITPSQKMYCKILMVWVTK